MEGVVEEARWEEGTPVLRLGTNLVVDLSAKSGVSWGSGWAVGGVRTDAPCG